MTDKDPKDMTVSEQLRWAANGEPYNGIDENIWTCPTGKIKALAEAVTGEWPSDNEMFSIVADKIDAELAEAKEKAAYSTDRPLSEVMAYYTGLYAKGAEPIGDWLDRWFVPRPRYEDGELVQFGDDGLSEIRLRRCYLPLQKHALETTLVYEDGEQIVLDEDGRVKRPAPEVLGADGKPIVAGETVWDVESGIEGVVDNFQCIYGQSVTANIKCPDDGEFYNFNVDRLTHTPPDTQRKINADVTKNVFEYWRCGAVLCGDCPVLVDGKRPREWLGAESCHDAKVIDLLRRQRELDKRTGGAE